MHIPSPHARAVDPATLATLFGGIEDPVSLWIAEPYVGLAPSIVSAVVERAGSGWYGYQVRPEGWAESFRAWMLRRHGWDTAALRLEPSPGIGTSIAVMIDQVTRAGEGVILQPPVYTEFRKLVRAAGRTVVRNPLLRTDGPYRMDLEDLEAKAAEPSTRMMILCNPHNPVGRAWTPEELGAVAGICARHGVFLLSDEVHADIMLAGSTFTPLAAVSERRDLRWAAVHGPIKTFGLAGLCDTLLATEDEETADAFATVASRLHLNRNNVLGLVAFETAYREGGAWLDELLERVATNLDLLEERLPPEVELLRAESTYLAWLDLRALGLAVPELAEWLTSSARLALSPGHWFGREGAGFARMTVAAPTAVIEEAVRRITEAVRRRSA